MQINSVNISVCGRNEDSHFIRIQHEFVRVWSWWGQGGGAGKASQGRKDHLKEWSPCQEEPKPVTGPGHEADAAARDLEADRRFSAQKP